MSGSARVGLDAEVGRVLEAPSWKGQIQLEGLDLPHFAADAPPVELTGRIETRGNLETARVTGTLDGKAPDLPDFGHLEASLELSGSSGSWRSTRWTCGSRCPGPWSPSPAVWICGRSPGASRSRGAWERLRWPLSGDLLAESPQGSLDASGTLNAYGYKLSGSAQGPGFPAIDLGLEGTGDQKGTRIEPLEVRTLDGTLTATGALAWVPELTWDLSLGGEDLNPAGLAPGMEDRLGFTLDTQGGLAGFQYRLAATTQGPGLPPAQLALEGQGDLRGTEIQVAPSGGAQG